MAKFYDEFSDEHIAFIKEQKLFFVATAPQFKGNINLSPKGYDTLKLVNNKLLIYADYYGSGNETAAHIEENERITLMWNSFDEAPLILRAYGKGKVIAKGSSEFDSLLSSYYPHLEARIIRQLFMINVDQIQSSCGWGVPLMTFEKHREKLDIMSKKHL